MVTALFLRLVEKTGMRRTLHFRIPKSGVGWRLHFRAAERDRRVAFEHSEELPMLAWEPLHGCVAWEQWTQRGRVLSDVWE
jgi:hypothetical protein